MKTILALINDPLSSENFVRYTTDMAAYLNFNLHLMYIQNPALYSLSPGTTAPSSHPVGTELEMTRLEEERRNALKSMEENLEITRNNMQTDISIRLSSETGSKDIIVNRLVAENKADIVVLENEHEHGFWNLETPNIDLILDVNCPCLVIPPDKSYESFHKIVYATVYHEKDPETIKNLITLYEKFSPEITALHISENNKEEEERLTKIKDNIESMTGYDKIHLETIPDEKDKNIAEEINEYAINKGASLIAILKQNRDFFERIFKRSTTRKVIKKASLPVLVYHEKEMG